MASASSANDFLASLQPGHWAAIPNSHLAGAYEAYDGPHVGFTPGAPDIITAWSGGTFETQNSTLLVWGGGHTNYEGNEVYGFSLRSSTWSRLSNPSSVVGASTTSGIMPDGAPSSRHTYGGLAYIPDTNQMFAAGGSHWQNGYSDHLSWLFDLKSKKWKQAETNEKTVGYGNIAAYDPVTHHVFFVGAGILEYDPVANSWASYGTAKIANVYEMGALDPVDRMIVAVGGGAVQQFPLTRVMIGTVALPRTSGDAALEAAVSPGFVWYPPAGGFAGWSGGTAVYTLDPHSWQWTRHDAAPNNKVKPTPPAEHGTFGRFQYDPEHKVFVVVNGVDQNVFVYKPDF